MPEYPTLTDCLSIISSKVAADHEREAAKQREIDEQTQTAIQTIRRMKERITNLVLIANHCAENRIPFPYCGNQHWWAMFGRYPSTPTVNCFGYKGHDFIANGTAHNLGLMTSERKSFDGQLQFNGIGIMAGGACGPINLWTDGEDVFGLHEDTDRRCAPPLYYLQRFIEEFQKLEQAFYAWIESLQEKGETK